MFYSRTQLQRAAVNHAVVPADTRYVHLLGLDKFTNYTIQVAAFTRIGSGALSSDSIVSTDEDGMDSFKFSFCLLLRSHDGLVQSAFYSPITFSVIGSKI